MKRILTPLLFLTLVVGACHKSDDVAPPVTSDVQEPVITPVPTVKALTTGVTGTIIPASAATSVEITGGGVTRPVTVDPKTGVYNMELPAGDYSIKVQAASGFVTPAATTVQILKDKTSIAGDLVLFPEGTAKTFQLYVNGILRNGSLTTDCDGTSLGISCVETLKSNTGTPEARIDQYTMTLLMGQLSGPGSYTCSAANGVFLSYVRAVPSIGSLTISGRPWLTWEGAGTNTKVNITQIDATRRMISGYFSGNLNNTVAGQGSIPAQSIFRIAF